MAFRNYDPAQVVVTFKGIDVVGYMDGTFVTADRTEDGFETTVGAGGDVTRVRSRNRSGLVTVSLKAEAPVNDELSAVAEADELDGSGVGTLTVSDLNGTTLLEAESAWIQKIPLVEYADTASGREWVFSCAELIMAIGGTDS